MYSLKFLFLIERIRSFLGVLYIVWSAFSLLLEHTWTVETSESRRTDTLNSSRRLNTLPISTVTNAAGEVLNYTYKIFVEYKIILITYVIYCFIFVCWLDHSLFWSTWCCSSWPQENTDYVLYIFITSNDYSKQSTITVVSHPSWVTVAVVSVDFVFANAVDTLRLCAVIDVHWNKSKTCVLPRQCVLTSV